MPTTYQRIQKRLQAFDFTGLFTQELMWNYHQIDDWFVPVNGVTYTLKPVAKRGMSVFECVPPTDAQFPKYATRRKIDTQVSKTFREHIIIFHDNANTVQVWQWVKREAGKPSACREQLFYKAQSGDALTQKIQGIAFELEDEPNVIEDVVRTRGAFDVEKVTKKFYDQFKKEHDAFLKFTKGIPDEKLQRWYASVMLNRLMFIYFIQKKGFLAGDRDYLTHKLTESQHRGKDKFYRELLSALFFEGFAKREEQRSAKTNSLLGHVPYLNGGLFLKHQIEKLHGERIEIPDKAFERVFGFFEQYDWHLDDRPTRTGREINPDVLGYVFEKYINQKEMGAYYTKEDITGYISQSTIVPALFDMARKSCRIAFEGEHSVWRLLKADPDRYIYAAMLKGADKELPKWISEGLDDVSKRGDWNKPADPEYALPTETWREMVARRTRCKEIRQKLGAGEIRSINDLITYNLDVRRFAEEVIANCEGPDLLRAFRDAIRSISVLDPACGSGAFLFAALNILERLYDSCLVRMQAFVDDLDRSGEKHSPEKFKDFRETLADMNDKARHPSPRYFILKSIVVDNLYGVDIMDEATEICKLRLFLKLVAQVNPGEGVEPLPDIDFNIRAGNTLVGFATEAALHRVLSGQLDFENKMQDIKERAQQAELAFERFREIQFKYGADAKEFTATKAEVQRRLDRLRAELDSYLSSVHGVPSADKAGFEKWQRSHQPFHWFVEFYGTMQSGGFRAIIGNPPWVEYSNVAGQYAVLNLATRECNNLWAFIAERSLQIVHAQGRCGLIVPMSLTCTARMLPIQQLVKAYGLSWVSNFESDSNPGQLFEQVKQNISILLAARSNERALFTTRLIRFFMEARESLFPTLQYSSEAAPFLTFGIPKISESTEAQILKKVFANRPAALQMDSAKRKAIYVHRIAHYYIKCFDFVPFFRSERDGVKKSEDYKMYEFKVPTEPFVATINSSLFYFYWQVYYDAFKAGKHCVENFPCNEFNEETRASLIMLGKALMNDLKRNSSRLRAQYAASGRVEYDQFYPRKSKPLMDEIDQILAHHYGLSDKELDFILNYDIKFRTGVVAEDDLSQRQGVEPAAS
jgi:Eco57I restriction-modification methylase